MNIPRIYAYSDERFPNCLKVGYTTKPGALNSMSSLFAMTALSLPTTKSIVAYSVWG